MTSMFKFKPGDVLVHKLSSSVVYKVVSISDNFPWGPRYLLRNPYIPNDTSVSKALVEEDLLLLYGPPPEELDDLYV